VASPSFIGLGVLSTNVYVENGGAGPDGLSLEWYVNTARFYSQIRNLRVDITAADPNANVAALHYQVAQATTIENVELIAKTGTVSAYFPDKHILLTATLRDGHSFFSTSETR
jgi:hypothetical protein